MLEDRYIAGIAAVCCLEPEAFGPELDPAESITAVVEVTLPTIDWGAPQTL